MEGPAIQTPSDELGNADWDRLCEMIPLLPEDRRFVNSLCILHREGRAIALFLKSSTDTKEMLKRCAQTADKLAEMLQTINQSLFAAFSDAQIELVDHPLVYFVGVARELQLLSFRLKASIPHVGRDSPGPKSPSPLFSYIVDQLNNVCVARTGTSLSNRRTAHAIRNFEFALQFFRIANGSNRQEITEAKLKNWIKNHRPTELSKAQALFNIENERAAADDLALGVQNNILASTILDKLRKKNKLTYRTRRLR